MQSASPNWCYSWCPTKTSTPKSYPQTGVLVGFQLKHAPQNERVPPQKTKTRKTWKKTNVWCVELSTIPPHPKTFRRGRQAMAPRPAASPSSWPRHSAPRGSARSPTRPRPCPEEGRVYAPKNPEGNTFSDLEVCTHQKPREHIDKRPRAKRSAPEARPIGISSWTFPLWSVLLGQGLSVLVELHHPSACVVLAVPNDLIGGRLVQAQPEGRLASIGTA